MEGFELDPAVFAAIVRDRRMSPDACRIVQEIYMLGPGRHQLEIGAVSAMLTSEAGAKRARKAVANAEACGWLRVVRGGTGMHPRYTFMNPAGAGGGTAEILPSPEGCQQAADAERGTTGIIPAVTPEASAAPALDSAVTPGVSAGQRIVPAVTPGASADSPHVCDQGDQKTSPPPPSPPAGARTAKEITDFDRRAIDTLRQHLGTEYSDAADLMAQLCPTNIAAWASSISTLYLGAHPTDPIVAAIPPPERPQKVAMALTHYAATEKPYVSKLFQGFLRDVIDGRRNGNHSSNAGNQLASRSGRTPAAVGAAPDDYADFSR